MDVLESHRTLVRHEAVSPAGPRPKQQRRLPNARWLRRLLLLFVGALVVVGIVVAWMPEPLTVDTALATRGPLRVTVDEDGRARVKDRYVVSAPINGSLDRIQLDPGDDVRSGQLLARIVPLVPALLDERSRGEAQARVLAASAAERQAGAQISRAEASTEFAKREAQRLGKLVQAGAISRVEHEQALLTERTAAADLESARFAARVASHELEMARAALRRLSASRAEGRGEQLDVPSPVNGRVLKVLQQSEGVVQAGAPLLEVGDPAALEIVVDVLTVDAVRIAPNARVVVDRWGGSELEGRVRRIEPSAFTRLSSLGVEEQRVNVLIDLVSPRTEWAMLGDGYRVEAHIVVWEGSDVLKIPASAAFRHGNGWAVYRVEEGLARLTPVEIGERSGRDVELNKGLGAGARIVVYPSDQIADGARVRSR
jgi:HlyD family secretion protein